MFILLNKREPISIKSIADELDLTPRIVNYSIKRLEQWVGARGISILKKSGVGWWIEATEEQRENLKSEVECTGGYNLILSREERVRLLIYALLTETRPLNMQMFAPKLGVSRPTIYADFEEVEAWLAIHGLKLVRQAGQGIQVEGPEVNLRMCMETIFYDFVAQVSVLAKCQGRSLNYQDLSAYHPGISAASSFNPAELEFEFSADLVYQIEEHFEIKLGEKLFMAMVIFFVILIERSELGFYLPIMNIPTRQLTQSEEYSVAEKICSIINERFGLNLGQAEAVNISANILGVKQQDLPRRRRAGKNDDARIIDEEDLEFLSREIIREAAKLTNPILNIDQQLYHGLAYHLRATTQRLTAQMPISNYLLEDIRSQYPHIYRVAESASDILGLYLDTPIPPEEIGFLAMHICAAVERLNSQYTQRTKAVLICNGISSIAWMLVSRLASQFPDLEVIGVKSAEDLTSTPLDFRTADLIISTVPFENDVIPVVHVSPLLSDQDKLLIAKATGLRFSPSDIEVYGEEAPEKSLAALLSVEMIQKEVSAKSREDAVEISCAPLLKNGFIDHRYVASMNALIDKFGPYMVLTQGVALLHGVNGVGVNKLGMSLTIFSPPIMFGHASNDPVSLAFLIASPDDHSHFRALRDLALFLDDKAFLLHLQGASVGDIPSMIVNKINASSAKPN